MREVSTKGTFLFSTPICTKGFPRTRQGFCFELLPWYASQVSHKFPKIFLPYSVMIAACWKCQDGTSSFITATCNKTNNCLKINQETHYIMSAKGSRKWPNCSFFVKVSSQFSPLEWLGQSLTTLYTISLQLEVLKVFFYVLKKVSNKNGDYHCIFKHTTISKV